MKIEDCIFFHLSRASRAGARHWHKRVSEFGVTASQALLVLCLAEEDAVTSRHLGSKIEFDSATLTGLIDRLEKAGFLGRRNNPDDRRAIRVCLTEKGKKTSQEISKIVEKENQAFLSGLTPEEAMILKALLKKIG